MDIYIFCNKKTCIFITFLVESLKQKKKGVPYQCVESIKNYLSSLYNKEMSGEKTWKVKSARL